jgi:putative polyhydroxyalkanoate system protein
MNNLTVSIPHRLGRDEARRRIQDGIATARRDYAAYVQDVQETWTGDRLDFSVSAMAQAIRGFLIVEEQAVHVEVELPWLLAMLAGAVRQQIEQQGRRLLTGPAPAGKP